jgi:hypothetical protein
MLLTKKLSQGPVHCLKMQRLIRLAQLSWRLERLSRMEAAMLHGVACRNAALDARLALRGGATPSLERGRPADDLWVADLSLVARYEAQLDNAFKRNMLLLERSREARNRERREAARANPRTDSGERSNQIWNFRNEANLPAEQEPSKHLPRETG